MKNVVVHIDTSDNKKIKVGLTVDDESQFIEQSLDTRKAQAVLPLLEELLTQRHLELKDLTGIEVNPGPGSFTGVRVGVTIANTLAWILKIPVNGKEQEEAVY
jgi:tRNA threonylcarbamoyladenosine biosynthesis protein TsaB